MEIGVRVFLIGTIATMLMDAWLFVLKRLGVPTMNFALLGRWVGHLPRGRLIHHPIAKAAPISGELWIGWVTHYATGIAFAALLVGLCGTKWMTSPSLAPAVLVGVATVAVPLLILQPALGAGIAGSKTPTPLLNCVKSVANHTIYGIGLYCGGVAMAAFS
jgi:hypothetical protein